MQGTLIHLKEQKYMGITTQIRFQDHDGVDFRALQLAVVHSEIANPDADERFMALDSGFQEDSFLYTPLMPVTSFEGDAFFRFTREAGEYYCFEVSLRELGPQWFQACFAYMEQNNMQIDRSYDLEYYPADYCNTLQAEGFRLADQTICLLFKKADA